MRQKKSLKFITQQILFVNNMTLMCVVLFFFSQNGNTIFKIRMLRKTIYELVKKYINCRRLTFYLYKTKYGNIY